MNFYHGSVHDFRKGDVIKANTPTLYYPEATKVLETTRPTGAPSRSLCVFATDKPVAAASYMQSNGIQDFSIYEVIMPSFRKSPFCILHELSKRIKSEEPFERLITEYWSCELQWNFYEYFGPEMIIIDKISILSTIEQAIFFLSYESDCRMVGSL